MQVDSRGQLTALLSGALLLAVIGAADPARAAMPADCAAMLDSDDVFDLAKPATADDIGLFGSYVGEFHSDRLTFDDGETEYFFSLRYEWFDPAKTTLKYSVTMVIPEQDREILNSEGYYGFDPFEKRIFVVSAFKRMGVSLAVLEHSDPDAGERRMLGRIQRPGGNVTLVSDQFEWIDDDSFQNRAFTCTTESGEWTQVYEGIYTRQSEPAG